jgi:hypothetical protein
MLPLVASVEAAAAGRAVLAAVVEAQLLRSSLLCAARSVSPARPIKGCNNFDRPEARCDESQEGIGRSSQRNKIFSLNTQGQDSTTSF